MAKTKRRASDGVLRISIFNGDLSFIPQPLMIGHYRSARLTGTERVMNDRIGGSMGKMLALGSYPSAVGTNQIFINGVRPEDRLRNPEPQAVIVVGLGDEGKLTGTALALSVRQAVIAWVQRVVELPDAATQDLALATTLIGSGGLGVPVGQSAQFIVQGVCEANERLRANKWPLVGRLRLIELYLDRATEAWRALQVKIQTGAPRYRVDEVVESGTGALKRPLDAGYRGAEYDMISAASVAGPNGSATVTYTLDTKRARSEVRAVSAQLTEVRSLVGRLSNHDVNDPSIRKTLFDLLIPVELEPFLLGSTELQLQLTPQTAAIPWELLDPDAVGPSQQKPWAVRNKLIRKLSTADFRDAVVDASADDAILVIGEPLVTDARYPPLPSARKEANAVVGCFGPENVCALISPDEQLPGPDADTVIKTIFARPWRILHISAHGAEPESKPQPAGADPSTPIERLPSRGVVLSDDRFLGPEKINRLRVVPELVFLNCCHLAVRDDGQVLAPPPFPQFDRAAFAASIADALINVGVRCVIAAGWAVEDEPARVFATEFYAALLRNERFIDAVATAREAALAEGGNTWAAYQCYGDPDWRFRRQSGDPQQHARAAADDEFDGVASPSSLKLALYTIATRSKHQQAEPKAQRALIRALEKRFAHLWGETGAVAEAFGTAWSEAGDRRNAIEWYERAGRAADGGATLKATEQLANLRVRLAWESVDHAAEACSRAARSDAAVTALHDAARIARADIDEACDLLTTLLSLHPTAERRNLLGSAYKRLAMVEAAVGNDSAAKQAVARMVEHYGEAEKLFAGADADRFYPAMNCLAADVALHAGGNGGGVNAEKLAQVQVLLDANQSRPDFWTRAGLIELSLYEALNARDLAGRSEALIGRYANLRDLVPSPRYWSTIFDHAQFILHRYALAVDDGEREAARKLLATLRRWRGAPSGRRRPRRAAAA